MFKNLNLASSILAVMLLLLFPVLPPGTLTAANQLASVTRTANEQADTVKGRAKGSTQAASKLSLTSFSAKGLNYEKELTGLYLGDFEHVRLEPDSIEFSTLFGSYLNAFARQCSAYLPRNKVKITRSECAQWQQPVNVYGAPVGPSTCIEYQEVGTGLYADPDLYAARRRVDAAAARNLLGKTFRDLAGKNPMGTALQAMDAMTSVGNDMALLLRMNKCGSPGLKRFQQNMMRFALGQPSLRLPGGQTLASIGPSPPSPGAPFKDSNYSRLLDDLITENSRAWMMNRYVRGSVRDVKVTSRDRSGRPAKIFGRYQFDGLNGRAVGSVTVQFLDGLPECIYFFDNPTTCRSPSRRVITAYENGSYQ
jgi:hypothetical protein